MAGPGGDPRTHATTHCVVQEYFAAEPPNLQPLPAGSFQTVLLLKWRSTRDGMVAVGGNLYSLPDTTRRRPVEVHCMAHELGIPEAGQVVAVHPVPDVRGQRRVIAGHRTAPAPPTTKPTATVRRPAKPATSSHDGRWRSTTPSASYLPIQERLRDARAFAG